MQQPDTTSEACAFARPDALNIQLLGACRIIDGRRVSEPSRWKLRKASQLVKQLALAPERELHREQIFEQLWPGHDPEATSNLRVTLHFARKLLTQDGFDGSDAIQSRGQRLALFPDRVVWTDIQAFEAAVELAKRAEDPALCQAALDLYSGELLPEEHFEDWATERRESLRSTRVELLLDLARLYQARGELEPAIRTLREAIDADPVNEPAHSDLMRVYASSGRRVQALRQYHRLRDVLQSAVDVEPEPGVTRFYESLLAHDGNPAAMVYADVTTVDQLSARQARAPQHQLARASLPVQLTSFIGRLAELPALGDTLTHSRLVTLTGPAGVGKTRLAIEVVSRQVEHYPDGIWFLDLSAVSDPAFVVPSIATTLEIHEIPDWPLLETITAELATRRALLVLDNCEHLINACADVVSSLLHACLGLSVLATSREPLWVDGEMVWPVAPLKTPLEDQSASTATLRTIEAIRLFADRAQTVIPGFAVTDDNGSAIAEICRRLEGVPLAIELAATRVRGMTVDEIGARLRDALGLLSGGSRGRPARQQSLRAAIAWSYDLLSPGERHMFERLAAFTGSVSMEAVEALCADQSDDLDAIRDRLFALLDKSLVIAEDHSGQTRYRMLKTIRQYAHERLESSGEMALVHDRQRDWYLALSSQAEQGLIGSSVQDWMQRLAPEVDNIRLVLRRSSEDGDHETVLRLASRLWAFWLISGRMSEGRSWIEPLLSDPLRDTFPAEMLARALAAAGMLAERQGDYRQAVIWTESALPLARAHGDTLSVAYSLTNLCVCVLYQGDVERTIDLAREGLALSREIGVLSGVPTCLSSLGLAEYRRGDLDAARDYLSESVAAAREIGFTAFASWLLGHLADIERLRACPDAARAHAEECIALGQSAGDRYGPALGRRELGRLLADQGETSEASRLIIESLIEFRSMGYKLRTVECVEDIAELAVASHPADTVRLLTAADRLRERAGSPLPPLRHAVLRQALAGARSQLDADAFLSAQEEGRAMSRDRAVDHVLSLWAFTT
ncbi:MAG TPA: BTAD domain-containing putative transcriptional regulator [Thermomicrobiales bacterium]|nr:BTAD domain-containing putative transcriptional regulator [Thermomicrobiales bacterium]